MTELQFASVETPEQDNALVHKSDGESYRLEEAEERAKRRNP